MIQRKFVLSKRAVVFGTFCVLLACAGRPTVTDDQAKVFLKQFCAAEVSTQGTGLTVEGSVFLRAKSFLKDQPSGQFSADLRVSDAQGLILQVLNPVGGKEAEIKVLKEGIWINGKSSVGGAERASWNGIPLRFAVELFLGRVPCPPPHALRTAELDGAGGVLVRTASGEFRYQLRQWGSEFFPESLSWSLAAGGKADFKFEDWDTQARYARKWEARSDSGEVKIKWRERSLR